MDTIKDGPYHNGMDLITDPAMLPDDRSQVADDVLIGPAVWAALQGVKLSTVYSTHTRSNRHRAAGAPETWDMPLPDQTAGQTPLWSMSAYRAWEAARPGKGAGAGRPLIGTKSRLTLGDELISRVDEYAEQQHYSRAKAIRVLLDKALTSEARASRRAARNRVPEAGSDG